MYIPFEHYSWIEIAKITNYSNAEVNYTLVYIRQLKHIKTC